MPAIPQSNLHLDILMGRDETIGPADVFGGNVEPLIFFAGAQLTLIGLETGPSLNIHGEMEKKLRM